MNFCARLGNCTEVVNHVGFCHTNTGITNGKDLVFFIRNDTDVQFLPGIEDRWVC